MKNFEKKRELNPIDKYWKEKYPESYLKLRDFVVDLNKNNRIDPLSIPQYT